MKNVFVTAVGGDIGSTILRCIRDGYECDALIGCDITEFNQGRVYTDRFYIVPPYTETERYLEKVKSICLGEKVTHFLPVTEMEISIFNHEREFFQENNIHLLINSEDVLRVGLSKYETAHFLRQRGIRVPKTWKLQDSDIEFNFPLVIKSDFSCGSKAVKIVSSQDEYLGAIEEITDPVIQECIGTMEDEYTVGIFSDGRRVEQIAFKRKLGFGGMSVLVETVQDQELSDMMILIARTLQLNGAINVQLRKQDGLYYVFEINPRISSTAGFRHKIGFRDVVWWLQSMDAEPEINYKIPAGVVIGVKTLNEQIFDNGGGISIQ